MSRSGSQPENPSLGLCLDVNPEHPVAAGQDKMTGRDGRVVMPMTD